MFSRFDENLAMTLKVIKETKRYGRTDTRTDARTDNVKTVYPPQTKFAGGIITPSPYFFIKNICLEDVNMVARFDEILARKQNVTDGRTDIRTIS